jgi:hypothetical protein
MQASRALLAVHIDAAFLGDAVALDAFDRMFMLRDGRLEDIVRGPAAA